MYFCLHTLKGVIDRAYGHFPISHARTKPINNYGRKNKERSRPRYEKGNQERAGNRDTPETKRRAKGMRTTL